MATSETQHVLPVAAFQTAGSVDVNVNRKFIQHNTEYYASSLTESPVTPVMLIISLQSYLLSYLLLLVFHHPLTLSL